MKLKAYAKLNLALDVLGKRQDGYHELDTVMQSISLHDIITIEKDDCISVKTDITVSPEKHNTAYIAAQLFNEYTGAGSAEITIEKHIPCMSGLGGSSADAAAVLIGLNELYGTKLGKQRLSDIARQIGADVPFCLTGGTARAKGIGEILEPIELPRPLYFVVVKPHQGVSTKEAFAAYRSSQNLRMESIVYALRKGDTELFQKYTGNALGMAALKIAPEIMSAASVLRPFGKAYMSGSGSSMFCIVDTMEQAKQASQLIRGDFKLCDAFYTVEQGVEITGEDQ